MHKHGHGHGFSVTGLFHGLSFGHGIYGIAAVGVAVGVLFMGVLSLLHRGQNRAEWDNPGLYGVVGRMGAGKSYLLAYIGQAAVRAGRPVYANYELAGAERYRGWGEVLDIPPGDPADRSTWPVVLLDEVHLWWSVEMWRAPGEVMAWASQLRKQKITVFWASQHENFVSKRLIRLTFGIWTCVRYRQGHQYTMFDGATFMTPSKRERLTRMYVKRSRDVMAAYDTNEVVQGSMEWGDGQGFERLTVTRATADVGAGAVGPEVSPPGSRLVVVGRHAAAEPSTVPAPVDQAG
jgi:hypothetical protein